MKDLGSAKRRELRAKAHSLHPVVMIGAGGLTAGVLAEVEASLKAHELIKIRAGSAEHEERASMCEAICTQTGASPVQHIGKTLVIYRERPPEPTKRAPATPGVKPYQPGKRAVKPRAARGMPARRYGTEKFGEQRRPRKART